jgi:hypothetical protein
MGIKKGGVKVKQTSQNTRKGKTTVIAFLDLSRAFDNVTITKLLQMQQGMKIEDEICVWNHNCLVGRTLMIQTNTFEVTKKYKEGFHKDVFCRPFQTLFYTPHEIPRNKFRRRPIISRRFHHTDERQKHR